MLAAQAALELAQPLDGAARAVRLVVPLDRSLLARKQALESALNAYGRAADYAVAGVTTAATYAMADLYRDFGRALLESERPRDLTPDELEQYDLLLEEQAFPFEEKAIAIHGPAPREAHALPRPRFANLAHPAGPPRHRHRPHRRLRRRRPRSNPAEKASLLAASISVAMNNTALGLVTAITLLLGRTLYLETKTSEIVDSLEVASVKFLNAAE